MHMVQKLDIGLWNIDLEKIHIGNNCVARGRREPDIDPDWRKRRGQISYWQWTKEYSEISEILVKLQYGIDRREGCHIHIYYIPTAFSS